MGQDFIHPSDVVKKIQDRFKKLEGYSANFKVNIRENNKSRNVRGRVYYRKGGKLRFNFTNPPGDIIVSDGKKMWVYVSRLRAVGVQDLKYKKNGKSIYDTTSYKGLVRLFHRYHYRFDKVDQPREVDGGKFFVLELKEKVSSGGYEKLILFVNPGNYQIEKISAFSASGRKVDLSFTNIDRKSPIAANLFTFKITDNMKEVENPLTTD